jgi:uncharacterized Zn ribbon protein
MGSEEMKQFANTLAECEICDDAYFKDDMIQQEKSYYCNNCWKQLQRRNPTNMDPNEWVIVCPKHNNVWPCPRKACESVSIRKTVKAKEAHLCYRMKY